MKAKDEDGALPQDPYSDNEASEGAIDSSESSNRPKDRNHVTSDKVASLSESDNRPAKPGI